MLREMTTNPALALSFKRFAQCAVAGLALTGLAACGGGGGGTGDMRITLPEVYTSLAVGESGGAAFEVSDSLAGARNAALVSCGVTDDGCQEIMWFRNACGALAQSFDERIRGAGWAESEDDAERNAIVACNSVYVPGNQNCHVPTASDGSNFTVCNKGGSLSATGEVKPTAPFSPLRPPNPALVIPAYVSIAFGSSSGRWGWRIGWGASPQDAKDHAMHRCRNLLGLTRGCGGDSILGTDSCVAIARSECTTAACLRPAVGIATGNTRSEAMTAAVSECRSRIITPSNRDTCSVRTSPQGEGGVRCAGSPS